MLIFGSDPDNHVRLRSYNFYGGRQSCHRRSGQAPRRTPDAFGLWASLIKIYKISDTYNCVINSSSRRYAVTATAGRCLSSRLRNQAIQHHFRTLRLHVSYMLHPRSEMRPNQTIWRRVDITSAIAVLLFLKIARIATMILITSIAAAITGNRIVHAGNRPLIETQSRVQHAPSRIQVRRRVKAFDFGYREYGA